jgi:hypothetical protein
VTRASRPVGSTTTSRLVAALVLVGLVGAEAAVAVGLHALGTRAPFRIDWSHLGAWVGASDPVDAVAALVRLAALGAACWLVLVTVAYAAARGTGADRTASSIDRAVLPAVVRRLVDAAVVALVAGSLATPAGAAPPPRSGTAAPSGTAQPSATVVVRDGRIPSVPPAIPVAVVTAAAARGAADDVVVAAGDNLWTLASTRLAAARGVAPGVLADAEVASYWRVVCELNRAHLRSGNPDLVYPGEVVTLPHP